MAFAMGVAKYVPPPNVREDIVQAYAHCVDPRCKGNLQEPVQAVLETTEWTFASRGGGDDPGGLGNLFLPMVENSQTRLRFADLEVDGPCPHCGKPRELSGETRPVYPIQVGGANALLRLQEMGVRFDPDRQEEIQKGAPETPLELLQRRYINDEITDEEFAGKQAVLAGGSPAAVAEVTAEVTAAQNERMREMQDQIDALLAALAETPKRGPGRPRKDPEA